MKKRKICIVTGTRAEYGLLYYLMREIQVDDMLQLQLIVTGMHVSPEFGLTYRMIERDGFVIDQKIEMLLSSDTPAGIAKSIGLGVIGFADVLARLQPDILVVLGDRYEIFAAVQTALVFNIPVAHIHGGEVTEGAIDEALRHSITKMAQLHFASAEPYRKRIIQLGEEPERVFCFGSPGDDRIRKLPLLPLERLEQDTGFSLGERFFLLTYHPVTTELNSAEHAITELLEALREFPLYKVLVTQSNSDTGGRIIMQVVDQYAQREPERIFSVSSLGCLRYLNAMRLCSAVIGNSSSGLLEAPLFRKAAVNIGDRQKGRLRMGNVIDCAEDKAAIIAAIRKAISPQFQIGIKALPVFDGAESVSWRIKEVLRVQPLNFITKKHFYDVENQVEI